ncbi:hypothetical protein [Neobacillus paridis]|uniref:hypothetical protein n=1 Tax=Neobacillus paridis TaxID=2803862 RepID=UPI001F26759A|nr:hypothetical protein [Neobacillus paridis]
MINNQINELLQKEIEKGIEEFKNNYINTEFEKKKLYAYLGKELVDDLKRNKAFIAGGTITSLFSNKEINDVDVYFRNEESVLKFLSDIWHDGRYVVSHTKKATQLMYGDVNLQAIHFNYFNSPEEIFNTFDFTTCMGCFDFNKEQFVLHPDFLKHNSQRILKFNSDTAFPIVSLLRVQKYEKKGFTISKPEFIRIILTCMNLDINTYGELKEQLGGLYGVNYDKLFEDIADDEFSLQDAIDKIANIALDEDYFKEPVSIQFNKLDDILDTIAKKPKKILDVNNKLFRIGYDGLLQQIDKKPEYFEMLEVDQFFKENKFYKFVKKDGDRYFSFYDNNFEYIIGQEVEANTNKGSYGGGQLYFNEKYDIDSSTYKNEREKVLIEASIKPEDFIDAGPHITAKKCTMIREVPEEEYEKWNNYNEEDEIDDWGI